MDRSKMSYAHQKIARLTEAGDRIIALISRISDQATEEQCVEHARYVQSLRQIWEEAKK